ncbi:MAG: copper chaperone PCu(A)C [Rickettsiales bacterium]|nr:copper chaperone PCu(A)C [Rickettsiales bacterium]
MKKSLIALALLLTSTSLAHAADIEISNGWVKPSMPGKNLTAAFFDLKNNSGKTKVLRSVQASEGVAEIHNTIEENGVMKMRHMDSVELPAGGSVSFKPRAKHIMLMELPQPLKEGDKVLLTLQFDGNESEKITLPVMAEAAPAESEHSHH